MTEAEWLAATDPTPMLALLHRQTRASERKMRLFAVACARDLLAYRPEAAEGDAGSLTEFEAGIDRAEAFADGRGALNPSCMGLMGSWLWVECENVFDSAYAVVGVDVDCGVQVRQPLEAIKDFRVNPAHWLRDVFGPDPFKEIAAVDPAILAWNQNVGVRLAAAIYEDRKLPDGTLAPTRLALLADALEDAGCTDAELLGHLRGPGPHVRGCWALDLVLGKS
jgi:hypothetical protein